MSDQPRDWDKELAAIDKVMAKGGGAPAPASVPAQRGGGVPQTGAPSGRSVTRRTAFTTWIRAGLGVLVAIAVLQWPYAHRCGLGMVLYLGAAATVAVAGIWTMIISWNRRQGWAHLAGLGVFLGGLGLVAGVLLPRLGYAAALLPWMCD